MIPGLGTQAGHSGKFPEIACHQNQPELQSCGGNQRVHRSYSGAPFLQCLAEPGCLKRGSRPESKLVDLLHKGLNLAKLLQFPGASFRTIMQFIAGDGGNRQVVSGNLLHPFNDR